MFLFHLDDEGVFLSDSRGVVLEVIQGPRQEVVRERRHDRHRAVKKQRVVLHVRLCPVHLHDTETTTKYQDMRRVN